MAGAAGTITVRAGNRVIFGSANWGAVNLWQTRFRFVTGGQFGAYLHYNSTAIIWGWSYVNGTLSLVNAQHHL